MLANRRHYVAGVGHLWKHDPFGTARFGALRKIANFRNVRGDVTYDA